MPEGTSSNQPDPPFLLRRSPVTGVSGVGGTRKGVGDDRTDPRRTNVSTYWRQTPSSWSSRAANSSAGIPVPSEANGQLPEQSLFDHQYGKPLSLETLLELL